MLEDNENCFRHPMMPMGVKGLRGNMVTSVRSGFKPFKHLVVHIDIVSHTMFAHHICLQLPAPLSTIPRCLGYTQEM